MKAIKEVRQGDVSLYRIEEFPKGEITIDKQCKDKILAYGELSGHCHEIIEGDVEVVKILGQIFLNAKTEFTLRHGKIKGFEGNEADQDYHNEIKHLPGKYCVGIAIETDHLNQTLRKVVD